MLNLVCVCVNFVSFAHFGMFGQMIFTCSLKCLNNNYVNLESIHLD